MAERNFLIVSQLFDSIGIIEKGIDKLYHYLLINQHIDDLKKVCKKFNLSLKRGYKIASVLNELDLVQIYDRPMKINLLTPIVPIWQKIINQRIEDLRTEFQEKIRKCEQSFEEFIKEYNLSDEVVPEPVEFISFSADDFEDLFYVFYADHVRIALGIRYENPLVSVIRENINTELPQDIQKLLRKKFQDMKKEVKDLKLKIIFSEDFLEDAINSREFTYLTKIIYPYNLQFKSVNSRVFEGDFSNFSLTKDELIQPSFDPTNQLIGAYISRNQNIYHIFSDKFNEIFQTAIPINDYLRDQEHLPLNSITKNQSFILSIL